MTVLTQAQSFQFKKRSIGVEDGLTDRTINSYFQDRNGFMWFGTDFGLNRYDANEIVTYTKEKDGLLLNQIGQIAQDGNDNLWLLGRDPLQDNTRVIQILNTKNGEVLGLKEYLQVDADLLKDRIRAITSHSDNKQLWFVTEKNEVYTHNSSSDQSAITRVNIVHKEVWGMIASPAGAWIEGPETMTFYNNKGDLTRTIARKNRDYGGLIGVDKNDEPFFFDYVSGADQLTPIFGLYHTNTSPTDELRTEFWSDKRFAGLSVHQGVFWADIPFEEGSGMGIYDFELNELYRFQPEEPIYSHPYSIIFDRYGNGWANHEGRINIIKLSKSKFSNYATDIQIFGINGYGARGLYVKGNDLYSNGLGPSLKVDLTTGDMEEFGPNGAYYGYKGDQATLKRLALITDNDGNLWYTDERDRIAKYNISTKQFTDYSYRPSEHTKNELKEVPSSMIVHWSAFVDSRDKLWVGRITGLAYLDNSDSTFVNFEGYSSFPELSTAEVFAFHENAQGIWIGATTGLYLLDEDGLIKERFHVGGDISHYLPFNTVVHIREDDLGVLWLATKGGGLIKFNPSSKEHEQWTTADGLSNNIVYASFEDDYGYIWISSNKGIMRMSKEDHKVNVYLKNDGLIHEEFNTGSYFKAADGRIFFGNLDGITMFDPEAFLLTEDSGLSLKLVSLEKQSKQTGLYTDSSLDLLNEQRIVIRPGELGFILNFSLLDYLGAESNTFSYRINETDAGWNYIDQPRVRINALPYGSYQLQLRGQGPQGQWSQELSIPIVVLRPFYLKWWFFVLIAIVLALGIRSFLQYRIRNLKRVQERLEVEVAVRTKQISEQAEELREMDKVKSRFFANVSHELRTPLTLILGPISNLLRNTKLDNQLEKELVRVERNGYAMSNLVEEILDLSKLDAKELKISEQTSPVEEYFRVIFENFLSHARIKDIDYKYQYHGSEDLTVLIDQRLVDRIVSNLLSNAFKYTRQSGSVVLEVFEKADALIVSVNDSGMGISQKDLPHIFTRYFQTKETTKPVHGGTGIGLAISKELSLFLGGDLFVESIVEKGSNFQLRLPKKVHLRVVPPERELESYDTGDEHDSFQVNPNNTNVLLLEDNLDMQDFVKELLSGYHQVDICNNGKEGLDFLAKSSLPDIIISDIMMPEMDGLEFLGRLREQENTVDIPVLMLTARSAEDDKLEAFTLGVDDYLIKPFSVEELKARVKNLLKNAAARKSTRETTPDTIPGRETVQDPHENWLTELNRLTKENISKVDFNIGSIAEKVGLSERQFQRNLKKITGLTPVVYVKEIRLQMAREYLEKRTYLQVRDVSRSVGFSSTPYFSQQFQERFGKKPSEYLDVTKATH